MKSKATKKIIIFTTLISVLSSGFLGFLGYSLTYGAYYEHFLAMKMRFAAICALTLDGDVHAGFNGSEAMNDPEYKKALLFLNKVMKTDPSITYLYTLYPSGADGFNYILDAEISDHDTVWIESTEFALECFFDSGGAFQVKSAGMSHESAFKLDHDGKVFDVDITEANGEPILYINRALVAKFRKGPTIRTWFTGTELTQESRERTSMIRLGGEPVEVSLSVTFAGESSSNPGSPYINTENNLKRLRQAFDSGMNVADPEPLDDTYGPIISCKAPIRTKEGKVAGLLVVDVSAREVQGIQASIVTALFLAFFPVALVMVGLIYLMIGIIVVKPLSILMKGVSKVKLGEDNHLIDIQSHDEFESFADAFNAMTFSVRENRLRLEDTVSERTVELERALSLLREKSGKLEELARMDEMTGLVNKHELILSLDAEGARLARYGEKPRTTSSLVFIDLDNFKYINDTFGHAAGDVILKRFADLLAGSARTCDITGRYGGDEFVVLLPDTPPAGALIFADRLRDTLSYADFFMIDLERFLGVEVKIPPEKCLGFSCGISAFKPHQKTEDVMKRADELLYEAKRQGKGRTIVDPEWLDKLI